MTILINQLDPNTGLIADGTLPITTCTEITRTQSLDKISTWSLPFAAIDPAMNTIDGKKFQILWTHNNKTHNLGQSIYSDHDINGSSKQVNLKADGSIIELNYQSCREREFNGATNNVIDVLNSIIPLRAGWLLGNADVITTAAPLDFWHESIFNGVAILAKTFNYHFREGLITNTVDFGAFGVNSEVLAIGGSELEFSSNIYNNDNVILIDDIKVSFKGSEVVNRLIGFGGGFGTSIINLGETTTIQPGYPVNSIIDTNGKEFFYIEDTNSILTYGLRERRFTRKDLRPITNSAASREFSANIVYEATLATLLNLKDKQTVYELSILNWIPGQVQVGDKINVLYKGYGVNSIGDVIWLDVDNGTGQGKEFFVLEIQETFGIGVSAKLKINENSVKEKTVNDLLADTIRSFENSQVHIQPTIGRPSYNGQSRIKAGSTNATFDLTLGPETMDLFYASLRIVSKPLQSDNVGSIGGGEISQVGEDGGLISQVGEDGGLVSQTGSTPNDTTTDAKSHDHPLNVQSVISNIGAPVYWSSTVGLNSDTVGGSELASIGIDLPGHNHKFDHKHPIEIPAHKHPINIPAHKHPINIPNHTHPPIYDLFEDSVRANNLSIKINGATIASGIIVTAPKYDYTIDITSALLAASNLQQTHEIEIIAGSDIGRIIFEVQVMTVIQPIII